MKRILSCVILVVILYLIGISANAMKELGNVIEPYSINNQYTNVEINIENRLADYLIYASFDTNVNLEMTVNLLYSSNNYSWTTKKNWIYTYDNVKRVSQSANCQVYSSGYYKLNVVINVYTLSGVFIESVENNKVVYYGGSGSYK